MDGDDIVVLVVDLVNFGVDESSLVDEVGDSHCSVPNVTPIS